MTFFKRFREALDGLQRRDLMIAIIVVAVVLVLGGNLLVLKPQRLVLERLKAQDQANKAELTTILTQLAELDQAAKSGGLFAAERQTLEELKRQIAEVDKFFADSDPTLAQVGGMVRNMLKDGPNLSLVSLKLLPSAVFYSPPAPKVEKETAITTVLNTYKKPEAAPVALTERTLYKHGVEVKIKGSYSELLAYLDRLEQFPKRLFWSEAMIEVTHFPETTLKLVVYSLSDQAALPLN